MLNVKSFSLFLNFIDSPSQRRAPFNPISTALFLARVGFVFKVKLPKFCTELLWDKMNTLR